MSSLEKIATFIVSVMKTYGFDNKNIRYEAGSMDNTLLRAIEGIHFYGDSGYLYIAGRNGDEYVSGNDRSLAVKYNGDRPNIPYLIVMHDSAIDKYFGNVRLLDKGGGYTDEEWVEPDEERGVIQFHQLNYTAPIDDNMYVGAIYRIDEDIGMENSTLCEIASILLGNYMLINHRAPDKNDRYSHIIDTLVSVLPTFTIGSSGQCKIPYYNLWASM